MSICDRLWQAACNFFGLLDLTIIYLNHSIFRQSKSVREKSSVTEASFCHKTNSVTEIGFCHTKVSFTEASFNNRNKCCPHAHPLELKVLQNLSFFYFVQNVCQNLYCHLAFLLEQSERTTFADLIKAFLLWENFLMVVFCMQLTNFRFISILQYAQSTQAWLA